MTERYFATYSGMKLPLKLVNELDPAICENRNIFWRATYEGEVLKVVEKVINGEIEMTHRYSYYPSGVLEAAEIDRAGEVNVARFNEDGTQKV